MADREGKPNEEVWSRMGPHEEFLELCALAAAGGLTAKEQNRLQAHLAVCPGCREAMKQFEVVVDQGIPALSAELAGGIPEENSSFSVEKAETAFFKRLSEENAKGRQVSNELEPPSPSLRSVPPKNGLHGGMDRFHFWLPLAAVLVLCATLGILTYRMGIRSGAAVARLEQGSGVPSPESTSATVEAASHDRDAAFAQLAERDKAISDLRGQMATQSAEIAKLRSVQLEQQRAVQTSDEQKNELVQERDGLAQQLAAEQAALEGSEKKLTALEQRRSEDVMHAASLEATVAELSRAVNVQEHTTDQQKELLAHDRDIRDLMGARDLYVAEVYDVERKGGTQKPFGRVFYTKGKSLIFYAYDLNDAPEFQDASTFQAWGWRGPDRTKALNLGMFYEDNVSKKRWVLKFNDVKTLQQIDAVFVTVEPHGGSEKPSGKPLLFAYLKVNANHP
jgi:predicted  nucleic acid-binding Zn-ribbon protein